jgi:hypothetical protein
VVVSTAFIPFARRLQRAKLRGLGHHMLNLILQEPRTERFTHILPVPQKPRPFSMIACCG